jgi:hypothetical protein
MVMRLMHLYIIEIAVLLSLCFSLSEISTLVAQPYLTKLWVLHALCCFLICYSAASFSISLAQAELEF